MRTAGTWLVFAVVVAFASAPAWSEVNVAALSMPQDHRCDRLVAHGTNKVRGAAIGIEDLVGLRDFGGAGLDPGAPPGFAVSPDGTQIVVQVRQADAASNSYCQALLIYNLNQPSSEPIIVAGGSDFVRETFPLYGLQGFAAGTPQALTPAWSPDGRWIAFLRRDADVTRLWIVRPNGTEPHSLTAGPLDVQAFRWSGNGDSITFSVPEALHAAHLQLAKEADQGYRYDDRFWTLAGTAPFPRGEFPPTWHTAEVDPNAGGPQQATKIEGSPEPSGITVSLSTDRLPRFAYRTRLVAHIGDQDLHCTSALCDTVSASWWNEETRKVIFARRERFGHSDLALYQWDPTSKSIGKLLDTSDALTGCASVGRDLVCGRESSLHPRDIIAIDCVSGGVREIVNLNPEWRERRLPIVHRLHWTNQYGLEAFGDLVEPQTPAPRNGFPLVVVQYESRGLLRGGTGDEYPIFPLAAHGFAVLSVSRPMDYNIALARAGKPVNQRKLVAEWMDRQSTHDSIVRGIQAAERAISVDRTHLAITGLSDGASAAEYALIHSRLFSLALLSTCCDDPMAIPQIGPAYSVMLRDYEYPVPWQRHKRSWRQMSLAMNAGQVCAQIQIQAADRELRMALDAYTSLRRRLPIALYVYPDEYHVKWQPMHRFVVYQRNIAALTAWQSARELPCAGKSSASSKRRSKLRRRKSEESD